MGEAKRKMLHSVGPTELQHGRDDELQGKRAMSPALRAGKHISGNGQQVAPFTERHALSLRKTQ
jgi:hypothetical protein